MENFITVVVIWIISYTIIAEAVRHFFGLKVLDVFGVLWWSPLFVIGFGFLAGCLVACVVYIIIYAILAAGPRGIPVLIRFCQEEVVKK